MDMVQRDWQDVEAVPLWLFLSYALQRVPGSMVHSISLSQLAYGATTHFKHSAELHQDTIHSRIAAAVGESGRLIPLLTITPCSHPLLV
mmetsp:Transcript_40935/g.66324  ORF Transcript_40935/g.66324 Transcript_40935/m.66324 type:complete len:89 (-) Transcript_40935:52-318(-)